jgi:Fic family protein
MPAAPPKSDLPDAPGTEGLLSDSNLQPAADEIRRHKEAIDFVRDASQQKDLAITIDLIRKIYLILHPSEGDLKTVRYRRDIPQHRLYFHDYAEPDKILPKVRQIVDWLNDPETTKGRHTLRVASRAHYDLLRVFPFQTDSGKVARLFMNLLLLRGGFPPAILHSTERQRYYDALKGNPVAIQQMVQEAVDNGLVSIEKLLDAREARVRTFA